jgi:FkbM family methyltransferase
LLIEAQPGSYRELQANAALRPYSDLMLLAPSCQKFEAAMIWNISNTGISLHESNNTDESFLVPVQCGPLSFYLQQLGVTEVDLLSLDVEGFEYFVLNTIDFRQVEFKVRAAACDGL